MSNGTVKIMGIVNINDDSFFPESRAGNGDAFCRRVEGLIKDGADIIDVGAVSSRPGSLPVPEDGEWERLEGALKLWKGRFGGFPLSVDTFRSGIVRRACDVAGPIIVNDIFAGKADPGMLPAAAQLKLRYIAMHHRGDFATMHNRNVYRNVTSSVIKFFTEFEAAAAENGVEDWILDPGFGFSKGISDNLKLLGELPRLARFGRPVLCGISHKRMTRGRDEGELLLTALRGGASILRVHDAAFTKRIIQTYYNSL